MKIIGKRNKKSKSTSAILPYWKQTFVVFVCILLSALFALRMKQFFLESGYFRIKEIVIEPSLQMEESYELRHLIGKNIFAVNLYTVHRNIQFKYPQMSQLKIVRRLPHTLVIAAKRREPFAKVHVNSKNLILDEQGVVLSFSYEKDSSLPLIKGVSFKSPQALLGEQLKEIQIQTALKIMQSFKKNKSLTSYNISSIDVTNLSKIYLDLADNLQVIMERDKIDHKTKLLELVLAQEGIDFNSVKYIDLRFKEPILGKK